jgi:conjugative relaxase-like TrwC/TraI family protein
LGDYYSGPDGEAVENPGAWLGGLAVRLGLTEEVTLEQLLNLLDGRHPLTGERLVPFRKDRVAAHDLTFSAPKSVSAVWALANHELRDEMQRAQDDAVAETMRYVERFVPLVRRGNGGTTVETAAAILAVAFAHHTSRQTAAQAKHGLPPDPQVHTHVLLPMAERHDGRVVAINSSALFRGRREIQAVYHAALAARLAALGFDIDRMTGKGGHYFEVSGVPDELVKDWSGRHAEIEAASSEWSTEFRTKNARDPTLVELRGIAVRHRQAKGRAHHSPAEFWRDVGAAHGVTAQSIDALRTGRLAHPLYGKTRMWEELLSPDGITREHAAVPTTDLRIAAMEHGTGLLSVTDVARTLNSMVSDGEVVHTEAGVWSTREMLRTEANVLDWAERMRSAPAPPRPSRSQVWQAMRSRGVTLSGEQTDVLNATLTGKLTTIVGEAGTGKTVVLGAAADVWKAQGRRVFAVAVAGATAQRLAEDMPGAVQLTMDGLITRLERGSLTLTATDVVAIDEAGMVDSRRWARLARALGAVPQIVALGDDAQLSPLSAGGLWAQLAADGPRLQQVRRTKIAWQREAWSHLRNGRADQALALYARAGHLAMHTTRDEAMAAAVAAWADDGCAGLLLTDADNQTRHALNLAAQQRCTSLGVDALTTRTSEGEIQLHVGDRVIFRRQHRMDGDRVENGATGEITAMGEGTITVYTSGRDVTVPIDAEDSLVDLGLALHVYKAQGATVDRSYVISGSWTTSKESLYVAASRSRSGTRIFLDRETLGRDIDADAIEEAAKRGARSRAKRAATPPRRVITTRMPLVAIHRRRQSLRAARAAGMKRTAPPTYTAPRRDVQQAMHHALVG